MYSCVESYLILPNAKESYRSIQLHIFSVWYRFYKSNFEVNEYSCLFQSFLNSFPFLGGGDGGDGGGGGGGYLLPLGINLFSYNE